MLFDLQGKRRRLVQAVYLTLAVLMGGGLVFFGIGSDVSGGLSEVFKGGDGDSGGGNKLLEERIDRNEEALEKNPRSANARKQLARDYYQLAGTQTTQEGGFSEDARDELAKAAANYRAYLRLRPKPDPSLANTAVQIFDALNRPADARDAAAIVAEAAEKSDPEQASNAYLTLASYARVAGDTRTADLAGQKAVDLAPKEQKKTVRDQLKQIEAQSAAGAAGGGAAGGAAQP